MSPVSGVVSGWCPPVVGVGKIGIGRSGCSDL